MKRCLWVLLALTLLFGQTAWAHVGSKDVFETVHAGPYTLYVTVRPPNVIPGVATVEVRSSGAAVSAIEMAPLPVTGEAAHHPPASDALTATAADPTFFTGSVWMMATGTWQVRFAVHGAAGSAQAAVPVLAVPIATLGMGRGLGWSLAALGLFPAVSMAGILGACVRDARLAPGQVAGATSRRRGLIATVAGLVLIAGIGWLGGRWWQVEAASYAGNIFVPSPTRAVLQGDQLDLLVRTPCPGRLRPCVAQADAAWRP